MSTNSLTYTADRAEQLASGYQRVVERIRAAEQDTSGARSAQSETVQLVTVTKFFPASDVMALYDAGVRLFGENRDQEAAPKAALVSDPSRPMTWLVGLLLASCRPIRRNLWCGTPSRCSQWTARR